MSLTFIIPGAPYGKGRPRIGKVGAHARMFTPEKTVNYENLVRHSAFLAMDGASLLEGPILVHMNIGCPVPASWSNKKRAQALNGEIFPTTKPDIDNVEKAIFDAMNGVVWRDDVQVVDVIKQKRYAAIPRVLVIVEKIVCEAVTE